MLKKVELSKMRTLKSEITTWPEEDEKDVPQVKFIISDESNDSLMFAE